MLMILKTIKNTPLNPLSRGELIIIFILLLFPLTMNARDTGVFSGTVLDSKTNFPLGGVTVRLEGTGYGSVTNAEGAFLIKNIKSGKYSAIFSLLGYKTEKHYFKLPDTSGSMEVKAEILLQEQPLRTEDVVVTASKRVQAVQDVPISVSTID